MKSLLKAGLLLGAIGTGAMVSVVQISQAQDGQSAAPQPLIECEALLPVNKQYSMSINLSLDTREGQQSELTAMLLDDDVPESVEIPEGTEEFFRCILETLGVSGVDIGPL